MKENSVKSNAKEITYNHTDKPIMAWEDKKEGRVYIEPVPNQGHCLAIMLNYNDPENARRLVACWNFCAGFTTEQIESSSLQIQMEKQRTLSGELGKAWGNQSPTPTDLATDRDLALMVLKDLIFAARTSGGTAGPDNGLISACEAAEIAFNKINPPAYFIATETGIADIETPPSDN